MYSIWMLVGALFVGAVLGAGIMCLLFVSDENNP